MTGLRVVVTGATGNIGTSLVRLLGEDDRVDSVLGIARRRPQWRAAGVEFATADLVEDDLDSLFAACDAVVHLGWMLQPSRDPIATWKSNVVGSKRVFEAAARRGVGTVVYSSSVGAYSPRDDDVPVDEGWPTDGWPGAAYTREKAYVERLLDVFEQRHPGIRSVRMRPAFVFKRKSASEQRRLFAGPFFPRSLAHPRLLPVVPMVQGLRFQAVHADDAAEAFRAALFSQVSGAFNLAAEPVLRAREVAELLGSRPVRLPAGMVRMAVASAWRTRMTPAPPGLFDAFMRLPIMDASRARDELGWRPRHTAEAAFGAFLSGLRAGAGMPTPPLASEADRGRARELATGVGARP